MDCGCSFHLASSSIRLAVRASAAYMRMVVVVRQAPVLVVVYILLALLICHLACREIHSTGDLDEGRRTLRQTIDHHRRTTASHRCYHPTVVVPEVLLLLDPCRVAWR